VRTDSERWQFELLPLRFTFVAREQMRFPARNSANLLRGAFGTIFRKVTCSAGCPGARQCQSRATCPYARMFEPSALTNGPSGLADWPRPFVFRASHLDGKTVTPDSTFYFDMNLFDIRGAAVESLRSTFAQLAKEGLGPQRARAEFTNVSRVEEGGQACQWNGELAPLAVTLQREERLERILVRFVTPTELKSGQGIVREPSFGVLAARIRDRVSTLRELYGNGPLEIDFRGFRERAERIAMTRCELTQVDVSRRSSRTGQVHSIGGFIGEAEYEGELGEFVPYLRAAKWTGVGRQTVWGKGEIHCSEPNSEHYSADK